MCNKQVATWILVSVAALVGPWVACGAEANLQGWWKFNGDGLDSSGNGRNGSLVNGASYEAGYEGQALALDGVDDRFTVTGYKGVFSDRPASVTAWVQTTGDGTMVYWGRNAGGRRVDFRLNTGRLRVECGGGNLQGNTALNDGEWHHVALTMPAAAPISYPEVKFYLDGRDDTQNMRDPEGDSFNLVTHASNVDLTFGFRVPNGDRYFPGLIDEVRIYDRELTWLEIQIIMKGDPRLASQPNPADKATDVARDAALSWQAGAGTGMRDVYLGTVFADVNTASRTHAKGVLAGQGQTATTYDPAGDFSYGQTWYWRVDEVNGTADHTIFRGNVWSFTVEPYTYPAVPVAATASGFQAGMEPNKTIDGSGMTGDLHGVEPTSMWMSDGVPPNWIQYEFDDVYQLYEMRIWNSNQLMEAVMGFGARKVTIEASVDGVAWTPVADVPEFARAPAAAGYAANTIVNLGGATAKYLKLTMETTWGGMAPQAGLSEVRFSYLPVRARLPEPATAATGVSLEPTLNWRPGRTATSHRVYFGADPNAVAGGNAPAQSVTEHRFRPGALALDTTYYWRVDEVNAVTYPGEVWSFTTQDYVGVDDFESYTIEPGRQIYAAWQDGFEDHSSGSQVGHLNETQGTFGETKIVHGGGQSMPLTYDNSKAPYYSEAVRTFSPPQDWTVLGLKSLSLWFSGVAGNTGQLYAKVNGTKVSYDGDAADLARPTWQVWNIDLSKVGKVNSVRTLVIGIEGTGTVGTLYLDDVRLYPKTPQYYTPVQPVKGPVAYWPLDGDYKDASGHGRNGTVVGIPAFAAGQKGQALSLGGAGDYVTIDNWQGILGDNPFTIDLWINSTAMDNRTMVCWGGATNGTRVDFRLFQGRLRIEHGNGNIQGNTTVADGQWHHVTLAVAQGASLVHPQVALYVDGLDDTQALADPDVFGTVAEVPVTLGQRRTHNDRDFLGMLDEVRIYDVALSPAEVAGLAGRTIPVPASF